MQHSVKFIGETIQEISIKRKDEKQFNSNDFFEFVKNSKGKYGLIENGDDFLVSTWYVDSLMNDYKKL